MAFVDNETCIPPPPRPGCDCGGDLPWKPFTHLPLSAPPSPFNLVTQGPPLRKLRLFFAGPSSFHRHLHPSRPRWRTRAAPRICCVVRTHRGRLERRASGAPRRAGRLPRVATRYQTVEAGPKEAPRPCSKQRTLNSASASESGVYI